MEDESIQKDEEKLKSLLETLKRMTRMCQRNS